MSIPDIRDRAYKMANELLGDYDQISETGRALRDLFLPFYSWMEVNATRYLNLLKNGFTIDNPNDFIANIITSTGIKSVMRLTSCVVFLLHSLLYSLELKIKTAATCS